MPRLERSAQPCRVQRRHGDVADDGHGPAGDQRSQQVAAFEQAFAETTRLGEQQGRFGERQGKLGERQGEIGGRMGDIGARIGELAARQAELALAAHGGDATTRERQPASWAGTTFMMTLDGYTALPPGT